MFVNLLINSLGEIAALSAASIWAFTAIVDNGLGQKISPWKMTLLKASIGIVAIVLTILWQGIGFPILNPVSIGFLLLSGVIGICFSDTCYFQALYCLGPRRALLLQTLTSPFSALLAYAYLHESLSLINWLGMGVTLVGVAWVIGEENSEKSHSNRSPKLQTGIIFGVLASMGQAIGAVLSRAALTQTSINPLWSTLLRLSAGVAVLLLWYFLQKRKHFPHRKQQKIFGGLPMGTVTISAFFGTFVGGCLQQTAFKYTATGVAQALCATSPAFILPIAMWMGEKVSSRAIQGVLIAFAGIGLLLGHV
ncbi:MULTISPECIES: DMT family transporter [Nostocales]|uniref:DMT family transporter n=3 Tax=Nostocales TaxID=1161 RepID=A0A0C1QUT2_9CYAN|nr:DMT family transporter [Tolypothrix bouteillei]KAF3884990.1 DMT family transporter [Tolypothrix bouteillei VB521301]